MFLSIIYYIALLKLDFYFFTAYYLLLKSTLLLPKTLPLRDYCINIKKEDLLCLYECNNYYIEYNNFFSRNKTIFERAIFIIKNRMIYANKLRFINVAIIINVIP